MGGGVSDIGIDADEKKGDWRRFLRSWKFLMPVAVVFGVALGGTPNIYENHNVSFEVEGQLRRFQIPY